MSICACMGPQGTDPLCPCLMRQTGLTPAPIWTPEAKAKLQSVMREIAQREAVFHSVGSSDESTDTLEQPGAS